MDDGDERVGVVLVAQDAADVGHGDEALCAELTRDARGRGVGVDVVDVPLHVASDGGHDRDVALVEHVEDGAHVDLRDLAHVAEPLVAHARLDHLPVDAGQADRSAALLPDEIDERLVDLSGEHHLHDVGGLGVRDAQTVDKLRLLAELLQHIRDLGPAAVHEHDLHSDEREQHDVAHDGVLELFADHGVAAVFDDDDLAAVFLNVGQRVDEYLCALRICDVHDGVPPRFRYGSRR